MIGLKLTPDEQHALRTFAALQPERSLRKFAKNALLNELESRLDLLAPLERENMKKLIKFDNLKM